GRAAFDRSRALPRAGAEVELGAHVIRRGARADPGNRQRARADAPAQRADGSDEVDGLRTRLQVRARLRGRRRQSSTHAGEAEEPQGVLAQPARPQRSMSGNVSASYTV